MTDKTKDDYIDAMLDARVLLSCLDAKISAHSLKFLESGKAADVNDLKRVISDLQAIDDYFMEVSK